MPFNDFVEAELPLRPSVATDGAAGQILVRSTNPLAPREMVWANQSGGFSTSKYSIVGALAVAVGNMRWYPDRSITLSEVYFSLGVAGGSTAQIDVKKNGVSIFSGTYPTVTAGNNLSSTVAVSTTLTTSDYLTVDVLQASGSNAVVVIQYS